MVMMVTRLRWRGGSDACQCVFLRHGNGALAGCLFYLEDTLLFSRENGGAIRVFVSRRYGILLGQ